MDPVQYRAYYYFLMTHDMYDETVTSNYFGSKKVTVIMSPSQLILKTLQFYEGVEAEQRRPPQLFYGLCSLTIWRSMHESSKVVTPGEYFSTFTRSLKLRTSHVRTARLMDGGTLKTPIPKCRLYWSFLFGVV